MLLILLTLCAKPIDMKCIKLCYAVDVVLLSTQNNLFSIDGEKYQNYTRLFAPLIL